MASKQHPAIDRHLPHAAAKEAWAKVVVGVARADRLRLDR
jgi:hypothetical protein